MSGNELPKAKGIGTPAPEPEKEEIGICGRRDCGNKIKEHHYCKHECGLDFCSDECKNKHEKSVLFNTSAKKKKEA